MAKFKAGKVAEACIIPPSGIPIKVDGASVSYAEREPEPATKITMSFPKGTRFYAQLPGATGMVEIY